MNFQVSFVLSFQSQSEIPYLSIRSNCFEEEDAMTEDTTPKIPGELKKDVNNLKTETLSH